MNYRNLGLCLALSVAMVAPALAQSAANLAALRGLLPVSVLLNTPAGKAALAANLTVTGNIQSGSLEQATLLPLADQQRQALKDAFITDANASGLADALGSKLGGAYLGLAHYKDPKHFTNATASLAVLFAYSDEVTYSDSGTAKYFFANGTLGRRGTTSDTASALLAKAGGVADVFGKAYGHPAGSNGADKFGNSRPFQTEPNVTPISGADFFNNPSNNGAYLRGPTQDLTNSPSFPSGHTTYGYLESTLLGILVPERYRQQIARAAEYGNDRIILGAHYAMDVIGGRTLALYDLAHLLANDPAYVGQSFKNTTSISDYSASVRTARADLEAALLTTCGGTALAQCAREDESRFADLAADKALVDATQTYELPVVYPEFANQLEDVGKIAPEAGNLLTAAFPNLTLAQADQILTETEGPGGGFLDNGSQFGLYSRLNLFDALEKAATFNAAK